MNEWPKTEWGKMFLKHRLLALDSRKCMGSGAMSDRHRETVEAWPWDDLQDWKEAVRGAVADAEAQARANLRASLLRDLESALRHHEATLAWIPCSDGEIFEMVDADLDIVASGATVAELLDTLKKEE